MQIAILDGVYFKYDDAMLTGPVQAIRAEHRLWFPIGWDGSTAAPTSWQRIEQGEEAQALYSYTALEGDVKIIRAERMSWQEVYDFLWLEQEGKGKRYTGVWSGFYDLASWLRRSVGYARTMAEWHLVYLAALAQVTRQPDVYDPTLANYLRERESALAGFLNMTEGDKAGRQYDMHPVIGQEGHNE